MVIIDVGELSEGYDVYVVLFFLKFLNEGMRGLEVGKYVVRGMKRVITWCLF